MIEDEVKLIGRAREGDAQAYAALYDRHYDAVYHYCYYRLGDGELAQDLAAEVFCRMVEKLDTFRPRGRPLLAWLYTIARNLVTDSYRHNGRAQHLPLHEAAPVPSEGESDLGRALDRHLAARCLARALAHLTEEQRQVILLKFVEDLSNADVARLLGKTEGAIKSLQHRALDALRRALDREGCYAT